MRDRRAGKNRESRGRKGRMGPDAACVMTVEQQGLRMRLGALSPGSTAKQ
jgi:hypothetical protein